MASIGVPGWNWSRYWSFALTKPKSESRMRRDTISQVGISIVPTQGGTLIDFRIVAMISILASVLLAVASSASFDLHSGWTVDEKVSSPLQQADRRIALHIFVRHAPGAATALKVREIERGRAD